MEEKLKSLLEEKAGNLKESQTTRLIDTQPFTTSTLCLSKREYFAAMAMSAMAKIYTGTKYDGYYIIANEAVKYADALLERLSEEKIEPVNEHVKNDVKRCETCKYILKSDGVSQFADWCRVKNNYRLAVSVACEDYNEHESDI